MSGARTPSDAHSRLRLWTRIARDLALLAIAMFILIHETLAEGSPNPTLIGAALACLGVPTALRLKDKDS